MAKVEELFKFIENGEVPPILMDSVRQATELTFSSFYNTGLEYLGTSSRNNDFSGIVGILSFVGELSWSISLGFSQTLAEAVAKKFLGFEIAYESEDMGDMVGELVNIAGGDIASRLDREGIKVGLSLPAAAKGSDIRLHIKEKTPYARMLFNCPDGYFWIEAAINLQDYKTMNQTKLEPGTEDFQELEERYDMDDLSIGENAMFKDEHVDCIKQAVLQTFNSICGDTVNFLDNKISSDTFNGIVGIVSLVGSNQTWSLMLGFPVDSAIKIAKQFAGFDIEYDSDDMGDVVGELANVLAGDAATRFDAIKIKVELSIPTIARGREMNMLLSKHVATMHMNFNTNTGDFWLKLATEKH